jgi:hypothetical protein
MNVYIKEKGERVKNNGNIDGDDDIDGDNVDDD